MSNWAHPCPTARSDTQRARPLRPELAAPLGVWPPSQLGRYAGGRAGSDGQGTLLHAEALAVSRASVVHCLLLLLAGLSSCPVGAFSKRIPCLSRDGIDGRRWLRAVMVNRAAPAAAAAAPTAQATSGDGVPAAGMPLVAAAMRSRTAMPTAVPSWAVVLIMPDAPPRQRRPTSVPTPVAATEDSPMPIPAPAVHSGTAHQKRADGISAASAAAMTARPAATTCCGRRWRSNLADMLDPAMTARLNGSKVAAACSGLRCSAFCRYKVTRVTADRRRVPLVAAVAVSTE